jgi:hypothetical protein
MIIVRTIVSFARYLGAPELERFWKRGGAGPLDILGAIPAAGIHAP